MPTNEQERLKQIRDRQLAARDPLVKEKQFQHNTSVKEKRMRKSISLAEEWRALPHIVKAPLYGLLLGILVIAVLPMVWISQWSWIASALATVFFIIFGVVAGNALDIRDRIRDHLKK